MVGWVQRVLEKLAQEARREENQMKSHYILTVAEMDAPNIKVGSLVTLHGGEICWVEDRVTPTTFKLKKVRWWTRIKWLITGSFKANRGGEPQ